MKNQSILDFEIAVPPAQISADRMMQDVLGHGFEQQQLTNRAIPFIDKQPLYLSSFDRAINSLNFSYLIEAQGEQA